MTALARSLRRTLLARPVNRSLRAALAPLPRRRVPGWCWRRLPVVGAFEVTLAGGERFRYRSRGEYLGRVLYWRGPAAFEPGSVEAVARLARTVDGFWDVGAYGGLYTLIAAAARPGIDAVAFEPVPDNLAWLRSNLALNGLASVAAVGAAVTDRDDGEVDLWVPPTPWTSEASLLPRPGPGGGAGVRLAVPAVSLDGFRRRRPGPPPGLIKIDAEGAEGRILAGARRTLDECRPIVVCEVLPESAGSLPETRRILAAAGYRWGLIGAGGVVPRERLEPASAHRNQLLWPAEQTAVLEGAGLFR
jgi:FkbM family methyltransferase